MAPIWLRTTYRQVEIATVVVLLGLGAVLVYEGIRLGPGWGVSGPMPGFFPFALTCHPGNAGGDLRHHIIPSASREA